MDANFRVNEIFTDEDTYDVIAKCYDIIYDEEFEKFLGNPDEFSGKENASNLLKDSNYEISDEIRADIEDIFGVVEFDKENEYGAGYQFYDFGDDIDDFDDEFDAYYDGYTEEDDNPNSAYNRLKVNARESFNLRESLNQIDIDTYNKYDLLNLYESCDLSENEKRALANIVYDQDDPRVIYDTLNDRFVGGKEIEMPERVKDGVIHEDVDTNLLDKYHHIVDYINTESNIGEYDIPTYDEVIYYVDDTISDQEYKNLVDAYLNAIKDIKVYEGKLELSDDHTMWRVDSSIDEMEYDEIVSRFSKEFEDRHNIELMALGRSSRHICVEATLENILRYNELKDSIETTIDDMVSYINNNYTNESVKKSIHEDTDKPNTDVIKNMAIGEERSFSLNNYYKFENFTKFWVKKTDDDNFEIWMSSEDGKDIANHTKFSTLSNTLYWFGLTTVDGGGDIPTEVNEAFGDSQEGYDFAGLNRELRQELPADEIDHYNSDLYVKVTPKSKEILKKYGIHNHSLLTTFIDQITHTRWYDLPFAYMPFNNTEVTEGYEFLDGTKVEAYSDYEIAEERAEELGLKMAEYGDYYNSDLSYCYWNKSGNRNDDAQVIVYYKFENGRPRPLTEMERETVMDKYGIDSFDNPALEDDMGTYFDDVQPELEEDWTHFTYKSGANPYIATNDKEANRIIRKYKDKCKKVKDGYYEIDDTSNETLSESKKPYSIHTVRQVKDFFRQGESLTNVISYLFTCDYEPEEVVDFLVTEIGCKEQLVKNNLVDGFGINVDNF